MMRRDAMRWLAWTVVVLLAAGEAAAQGRRDRDRRNNEIQRYETALGIQVREGRRPLAGVEVTLRPEGQGEAPALSATTDAEGQAVVWGLAPGVWRLELATGAEPDFVLSVRVLPERRAEQVGAAARDVDAPDLRWRFFRVTEPPPAPIVRRPEPPPTAPGPAAPRPAEPGSAEPRPAAPVTPPAAAPPQAPPAQQPPPGEARPPATAQPEAPAAPPVDQERPAEPAPEEVAEEGAGAVTPAPSPQPTVPPPAEPSVATPPPAPEVAEPAPADEPVPADESVPAQPTVPGLVREGGTGQTGEARPAEPAYEPPADEPQAAPADEPVPHMPVPEDTLVRTSPQPVEPPPPPPVEPEPAQPQPTEPQPTEPQPLEPQPSEAQPSALPPTAPRPAEPPVRSPEMPQPPVLEQEIPPVAAPQEPPPAIERPEPPQAPMPPMPPAFGVRSSEAGDCDECRRGEVVATVERTVAPGGAAGGAECAPGMAAAALSAARRQAGSSAPQPLDGAEVAAYMAPGASCQLFGVVLPPGAQYRGFELRANGQWCAPEGECARVPGVVWPARPVIRELEGGATLVHAVLRNISEVPQRGELAVFYIPAG